MSILIVDDDDIALCMLKDMLEKAGYEVETASDGRQAIELLEHGSSRLVISDWEMPEMNGLELCEAVRSSVHLGYVYLILLTAHNSREHVIQGLSAGADDFVGKPFDPDELLVRVRAGERILSLETRDVTIIAMAKLAESRDPETGGHLERIQNYCHTITKYLFIQKRFPDLIDPEFVRLIHITSPLHDIGKVGISDRILLKQGPLTEEEFEVMKTHTTLGAKTLEAALQKFPNARYLQMARDIALTHHERFDGKGYPSGLSGEAIPLSGRIMALADVYDALTSKKVYREGYSHEQAESMIFDEAGSHFDPAIVEAFERNRETFLEIRERYQALETATASP
jgi:putative two-component system response regulator